MPSLKCHGVGLVKCAGGSPRGMPTLDTADADAPYRRASPSAPLCRVERSRNGPLDENSPQIVLRHLPRHVGRELEAYLKCGILTPVFVRMA